MWNFVVGQRSIWYNRIKYLEFYRTCRQTSQIAPVARRMAAGKFHVISPRHAVVARKRSEPGDKTLRQIKRLQTSRTNRRSAMAGSRRDHRGPAGHCQRFDALHRRQTFCRLPLSLPAYLPDRGVRRDVTSRQRENTPAADCRAAVAYSEHGTGAASRIAGPSARRLGEDRDCDIVFPLAAPEIPRRDIMRQVVRSGTHD
jgi:hypothetical protein